MPSDQLPPSRSPSPPSDEDEDEVAPQMSEMRHQHLSDLVDFISSVDRQLLGEQEIRAFREAEDSTYSTDGAGGQHLAQHEQASFNCLQCGDEFLLMGHYMDHHEEKHPGLDYNLEVMKL